MTNVHSLRPTIQDVIRITKSRTERDIRLLAQNPKLAMALRLLLREVATVHLKPPIPEDANEILERLAALDSDTPLGNKKLLYLYRDARARRDQILERPGDTPRRYRV